MIHTVKGFGIVNKSEIDVFLELSCFFHDPADVGNLISVSSAFSKTNLNIREFTKSRRLRAGSLSVADRSYPTSQVRGSSLECQAPTALERPRGATPRPRSVAAGRRHPASEIRGSREKPPRALGQGR